MSIIDSYTIEGSDIGIERYDFQINIFSDIDAHPGDSDCYTDKQVAAWKDDEWEFVGVEVVPTRQGVTVHGAADALFGVEYGDYILTDENDNVTGRKNIGRDELLDYPIKEMAEQSALTADALIAAL